MIENSIYLIAYLFSEFIDNILAYIIIFQAPISKSRKKWSYSILAAFVLHILVMYYGGLKQSFSLSILTMLIIPTCLLEVWELKNYFLYPFIVMAASSVAVGFSFILSMLLGIPGDSIAEDGWLTVLCQIIPAIILILLYGYQKVRKSKPMRIRLGIQQYILFYTAVFCIFLMLGTMQMLSGGDRSERNMNLCGLAISISCIVFIILVLWQGIVVYREMEYKKRSEINEKYLEMQSNYFRSIMEQDEKMRRFRHDMNVHIIALKSLCKNENNGEAEKYLENIVKESAIYDVDIFTGNKSVDAVMKQLMEEADSKQIKVEINGMFPSDTKVTAFDLCTVSSNLIKNAIEACEKIDNISNRIMKMNIYSYQSLLFITVKNTVASEVKIIQNRLISTKANSKNHGLGSGNIERTVNKYNGSIEYSCSDGWFKAELQL